MSKVEIGRTLVFTGVEADGEAVTRVTEKTIYQNPPSPTKYSYSPHKRPVLRVVLRIVVYYSELNPIFQNPRVVLRTARKDSTGE